MQTVHSIAALRKLRKQWAMEGKVVGFVPTMGNLHAGHLELIRTAASTCDIVVSSIFVNPLQFGKNEDLATYPRTIEQDKSGLEQNDTDVLFLPSVEEMYPRGLNEQTFVEVPGISSIICGASRPGHFRGVATVVCKLLNMVQPDKAFFGEKDYQQLQVIHLMAGDLSLDIDIRGVPIQRAGDGLALSSRNGYLTTEQRQLAPQIFVLMNALKQQLEAGDTQFAALIAHYQARLAQAGFTPDYVEIRNAEDLAMPTKDNKELIILMAAYLGETRLIDNIRVTLP